MAEDGKTPEQIAAEQAAAAEAAKIADAEAKAKADAEAAAAAQAQKTPEQIAAEQAASEAAKVEEEKLRKEKNQEAAFRRIKQREIEARAEALALKVQLERLARGGDQPADGRPVRTAFNSDLEYFEAARAYDSFQLRNEFEQKLAHTSTVQFENKLMDGAKEIPDFDDTLTEARAEVNNFDNLLRFDPIVKSQYSAQIIHELAKKPEFANQIINGMPAHQAAYEIGKIEARIEAGKTAHVKSVSNAPPPVKPIQSRGSVTPKKSDEMSDKEWFAHRKEQKLKALTG
jgi:hypothetical protein